MKIKLTVMVIIICYSFTACTLAQGSSTEPSENDYLIGVFVTEMIDLNSLSDKELNELLNEEQTKSENKIYAEIEKTNGDSEYEDLTYTFPDIDGYPAFFPYNINKDYTSTNVSSIFSKGHFNHHYTDESSISKEIELTILTNLNAKSELMYHVYPVFQQRDGKVYFTKEGTSGISVSEFSSKYTYEESSVIDTNGEKTNYNFYICITFEPTTLPDIYIVNEFDENNKLVSQHEFQPAEFPNVFNANIETEYIILESHSTDKIGEIIISRELITKVDTTIITIQYHNEDIIINEHHNLIW